MINEILFENIVARIFEEAEYVVRQNVKLEETRSDIDIIAEKNNKSYCVEVKYSQLLESAVKKVYLVGTSREMIPVIVVGRKIDKTKRKYFEEKF